VWPQQHDRVVHFGGSSFTARLQVSTDKANNEEFLSTANISGGSKAVLSQKPLPTDSQKLQMLSFYHFGHLHDPIQSRNDLFAAVKDISGLRGTIYLAREGINAQMAVPPGLPLEALLNACSTTLPFDPFVSNPPNLGEVVNIDTPTFNRLVVRVRDYILRAGIDDLDWSDSGPELSPSDWHDSIKEENDFVLLDCRNSYESEQGTFDGAMPLGTETFQESWEQLEKMSTELPRDKPVYIFCTGGIRCKYTPLVLFFFVVVCLFCVSSPYVDQGHPLTTTVFCGLVNTQV
jgi:rhodanese-related sulfurtransferase